MAMVKLIRTLAPENGMDFMDILSFETENYVGLWSFTQECFVLIEKQGDEFRPLKVSGDTLSALDEEVYKFCDENIIGVSDRNDYKIILHPEN